MLPRRSPFFISAPLLLSSREQRPRGDQRFLDRRALRQTDAVLTGIQNRVQTPTLALPQDNWGRELNPAYWWRESSHGPTRVGIFSSSHRGAFASFGTIAINCDAMTTTQPSSVVGRSGSPRRREIQLREILDRARDGARLGEADAIALIECPEDDLPRCSRRRARCAIAPRAATSPTRARSSCRSPISAATAAPTAPSARIPAIPAPGR